MDFSTNSVLNDVNVPNHIDDCLNELFNSTWDHSVMNHCDLDDLYAELSQPPVLTPVASPTELHKESDVVPIAKEENVVQNDQEACSALLTPQPSPEMCNGIVDNLPTVQQPGLGCNSNTGSEQVATSGNNYIQLMNAVETQNNDIALAYSNEHGVVSTNQFHGEGEQKYSEMTQQIKIETIYNEQQSHRASVKPAPIHVAYQSPKEVFLTQTSFSPSTYIPYYTQHRVNPKPSVIIDSKIDNGVEKTTIPIFTLATKAEQESLTDANEASPTTEMCCEFADSMEPAPGTTCAEYLSSVQLTSDCPEPSSETTPTYFIYVPDTKSSPNQDQVPTYHILLQPDPRMQTAAIPVFTESAPQETSVHTIDPSVNYVQIQNKYVLPSSGTSKTYPVEEIYRVDRPPSAEKPSAKKKPRKANITYGTEFYCNICCKEFGKRGSYQQHWRQKHEENRPFRCETCGKSYLTERDLRQHKQNHDPNMKQWKCSECDNRYRHMKDRDRHYDTHHGTPAHPCMIDGCPKAFARRDHMLAHLVSHDNRMLREIKKAQVKEEKEQNRKQRGRKRKME